MLEEGGEKPFTGICEQMVRKRLFCLFHYSKVKSYVVPNFYKLRSPKYPIRALILQADHLDITMIDDNESDEKQEKSIIAKSDALDVFA